MAFLKDAIKALDPTPDKTKEMTLTLNLISELSESKANAFQEEVAGSFRTAGTNENRTVPITLQVASHKEYRAYVKSDAGKIAKEVSDAVKKFVAGGADGIITGVADLVTTGLTAILGAGEATQQEMRSYFMTAQALALVRYDILVWRRNIEVKGITDHIESCMAIYASKASIDVKKLDLNTFLLAYEDQLLKMGFDEKTAIQYITDAETVYYKLKGEQALPPKAAAELSKLPNSAPTRAPRHYELLAFTPAIAPETLVFPRGARKR